MRNFPGLLAVAVAGACSQAPRSPSPEIFTLFDAQRLAAERGIGHAVATTSGLPGGLPLAAMLNRDDTTQLASGPTRTADYVGTYATTEVWNHFDRIWIQPMYVLVSGWENGRPVVWPPPADDPTRRSWIFSVGPESGFYSPFWQMIYVEVADEVEARKLTSARQVLESGYVRRAGPGHMVALAPDDLTRPPDTLVGAGHGLIDGRRMAFFDFGTGLFEWDAEGVVKEFPIYVFLMRNKEGKWVAPPIPTVASVAQHGATITPDYTVPVIGGQHRWPALWRIYTVKLPPAARVVAPKDSELFVQLGDLGLAREADVAASVHADPRYVGEVVLDAGPPLGSTDADGGPAVGCFAGSAGYCRFVDSQFAIQAGIDPSAIERTNLTVTCPFMTQQGVAVRPLP